MERMGRKNDKIAPWNWWNPWAHSFHSWHSIFLFKFMQISIYALRWFYYICALLFVTHHQTVWQAHFSSAFVYVPANQYFLQCIQNLNQHLFAIVEWRLKCENWIHTQRTYREPWPRTKMQIGCSQMNMLSHSNKSSACAAEKKRAAPHPFSTRQQAGDRHTQHNSANVLTSDRARQKPFSKREQENKNTSSNLKIYRIQNSRASYTHIFHLFCMQTKNKPQFQPIPTGNSTMRNSSELLIENVLQCSCRHFCVEKLLNSNRLTEEKRRKIQKCTIAHFQRCKQ